MLRFFFYPSNRLPRSSIKPAKSQGPLLRFWTLDYEMSHQIRSPGEFFQVPFLHDSYWFGKFMAKLAKRYMSGPQKPCPLLVMNVERKTQSDNTLRMSKVQKNGLPKIWAFCMNIRTSLVDDIFWSHSLDIVWMTILQNPNIYPCMFQKNWQSRKYIHIYLYVFSIIIDVSRELPRSYLELLT